jgi:hypothetical protein
MKLGFALSTIPVLLIGIASVGHAGSFRVSGPDLLIKQIYGVGRSVAISDDSGGVYVAWAAKPVPCEFCDDTSHVFVQRLTSKHTVSPGWPTTGRRVATSVQDETEAVLTLDGQGGVIVAWRDLRSVIGRIYGQRLDSSGNLAAGWPVDGVELSGQFNSAHNPLICTDGAGGAFVVWADGFNGSLYAQHVTAGGSIAAGWPASAGILCQAPGDNTNYDLCPDGSGGFFVAWEDTRSGSPDVYALHVSADGTLPPGWTTNGNAVSTAIGLQRSPRICTDGAAGVLITWMDNRNDPNDIYAQRLHADGTSAAGWVAGGSPVCQAAGGQWNPVIASDEAGGAYVVWHDRRDPSNSATYAARVTRDGSLAGGWTTNGVLVSTGLSSSYLSIASDGQHGFLVEWDNSNSQNSQIFAQRIGPTGAPTPGWPPGGLLAATSASTQQGNGAYPICLTVDSDGGPFLVWEEDRVQNVGGTEVVAVHLDESGSTVVAVPPIGEPTGALDLSIPSLSHGAITVRYSIPEEKPAQLHLIDVSGRILWQRDLHFRGRGTHEMNLETAEYAPGVYWVRLSQAGRSAAKRIVLIP